MAVTGFNIPPEIYAQLAASGFRPPPPVQMPGFNLQAPNMQQPQQQGMSMGDGMALAGMGMMGLGMQRPGSTPGDVMANAPSSVGGQSIDAFRGPGSYSYGKNAIDFLTGQQLSGIGATY